MSYLKLLYQLQTSYVNDYDLKANCFAGVLRGEPAGLPRLVDGLRRRRGAARVGSQCK